MSFITFQNLSLLSDSIKAFIPTSFIKGFTDCPANWLNFLPFVKNIFFFRHCKIIINSVKNSSKTISLFGIKYFLLFSFFFNLFSSVLNSNFEKAQICSSTDMSLLYYFFFMYGILSYQEMFFLRYNSLPSLKCSESSTSQPSTYNFID